MKPRPRTVALLALPVVLAVGIWGGVEIHEELARRGCVNLAQDVAKGPVLAPGRATVRFLALGDTGTGDADQRRVARTAARLCKEPGCDFLVLLGDNFYERGVTSLQDPKFTRLFEEMYGDIGKPVYAVLGNHDVKEKAYSQVLYSLKSPTWRMPNFSYAFRAGPARFTVLNTNCYPLFLPGLGPSLASGSGEWTFLLGHHTLYSSGNHGDADWLTRWYWQATVAEHLDFYLSGHDHQLEHLRFQGRHTDFIVSGAGGRHSRNRRPGGGRQSAASSLFLYKDNGLVAFEVSPQRVRVRFHDGGGAVLYEFVKEKP